jgi:CheY-like chemotaxis protein
VARILIIDDDATVGITLGRMLELQGHVVTRVETAAEGLDRATVNPPDAVILDMRMPVMGGLDFVRRLRSEPRLERLPIGIVTGDYFLDEKVIAELGSLGATIRYKPVWMDDLAALTRTLLGEA